MKEIGEVFRGIVDTARSPETRATNKMLNQHLYVMGRWTLGAILHPVATFQAVMLIGDQDRINRNIERALSLPRLPIGRKRLHP